MRDVPEKKIDAYTHFQPRAYLEALDRQTGGAFPLSDATTGIPTLTDVKRRLDLMDKYGIDTHVLVLGSPAVEVVVSDPEKASELAALANDGIAEVVSEYPDRFVGVASVAMNNPEAMVAELERSVTELGLAGVLVYSSAAGRPIDGPEFEPFYQKVAQLDVPIWLHPERPVTQPDYVGEEESKYAIWQVFGWPFETTAAMTRLVFSGVLERYPELKIIVHHHGAMLPPFAGRVEHCYDLFEMSGQDYGAPLPRPYIDYFKMFYADTASMGSTPALMNARDFFGPDHLVFGTDVPFDIEYGEIFTRETLGAVERMEASPAEIDQIMGKNILKLLKREGARL